MTPGRRGPKRSAEAAFVALAPKLAEALKGRHKIAALYEEYGAGLGISYSQFARYVARHITKKESKPGEAKEAGMSTPAAALPDDRAATPSPPPGPRRAPPRDLPTFTYDPMDAIRIRDERKD